MELAAGATLTLQKQQSFSRGIKQITKVTMVKRSSSLGGYISNGKVAGSNPDQRHFRFFPCR